MNVQQRESLVASAETAFFMIAQQVDHLLELINFYLCRYTEDDLCQVHKNDSLEQVVQLLAIRSKELSSVVARWKANDDRIISRVGVEVSILNELFIVIDTTAAFMSKEGLELYPFNFWKFTLAWNDLININKKLH